jgi:hypothetical protein
MTMLAIRMFLGGALSKLWAWLSHRSFWQIVCMALAAFALVQHFQLADARHDRDAWRKQFNSEHSGRLADRTAYTNAQAAAAAQNKAHVADVEAQQQRISDERLKDANDRLARLAGELRARGPAAQGHSSGAGSPALPGSASGVDAAPGLCLSSEQLLRAAQDEERHAQLIQWIEQQLKVNPNK